MLRLSPKGSTQPQWIGIGEKHRRTILLFGIRAQTFIHPLQNSANFVRVDWVQRMTAFLQELSRALQALDSPRSPTRHHNLVGTDFFWVMEMELYYRISRGLGKVPFGAWEVFCDSAEQGGLPRAGVVANLEGPLNESLWKQICQKFIWLFLCFLDSKTRLLKEKYAAMHFDASPSATHAGGYWRMQGSAQNITEDPAKLSKFAPLESPLVHVE